VLGAAQELADGHRQALAHLLELRFDPLKPLAPPPFLRLVADARGFEHEPLEEQQEGVDQAQTLGLDALGRWGAGPGLLLPKLVLELVEDFFDVPAQAVEVGDEAGGRSISLVRKAKTSPSTGSR
jgi:hypothetical protein